jgi:hypothetical protein
LHGIAGATKQIRKFVSVVHVWRPEILPIELILRYWFDGT